MAIFNSYVKLPEGISVILNGIRRNSEIHHWNSAWALAAFAAKKHATCSDQDKKWTHHVSEIQELK